MMLLPLHTPTTRETVSELTRASNTFSEAADGKCETMKSMWNSGEIRKPVSLIYISFVLVEDYQPGSPRFAALVASHESFYTCRRFSYLRARLLVEKQDKLTLLEERLENIDRAETSPLFLASNRLDRNQERRTILGEIDNALADYGMYTLT
jgi:hypothetical protein